MGIRQGAMENLELTHTARAAFWRDRRVLLTGHTGFKGAWLTLWLHRLGAKVDGHCSAASDDAESLRRSQD